MKRLSFLLIVIILFGGAWYLGQPGNPPAPTKTVGLKEIKASSKETGAVKGVTTDQVAPVSKLNNVPKLVGKGTILNGDDYDLGSGVASVVYQIQRNSDGAVWGGDKWQENVGYVAPATLNGSNFSFTIPVYLLENEKYVIRTQAIDGAGNAQTKWSEYSVEGKDISSEVQVR